MNAEQPAELDLECATCDASAIFRGLHMSNAMDKAGRAGWALQLTHPRRAICKTCGEKLLAEERVGDKR